MLFVIRAQERIEFLSMGVVLQRLFFKQRNGIRVMIADGPADNLENCLIFGSSGEALFYFRVMTGTEDVPVMTLKYLCVNTGPAHSKKPCSCSLRYRVRREIPSSLAASVLFPFTVSRASARYSRFSFPDFCN